MKRAKRAAFVAGKQAADSCSAKKKAPKPKSFGAS
jgi:hypothetical protein